MEKEIKKQIFKRLLWLIISFAQWYLPLKIGQLVITSIFNYDIDIELVVFALFAVILSFTWTYYMKNYGHRQIVNFLNIDHDYLNRVLKSGIRKIL